MSSTSQILRAPMRGVVVPLAEIPDPAFAEGALGPGIAIDPLGETLHAPCNGEVIQCARTAHAVTLRDDGGLEWLVHIGLDTVDLGGEGFDMLVAVGERVSAGDPLCRFDADLLARRATALITPVVLTNDADLDLEALIAPGAVVEMGEDLLRWRAPGDATADATADAPARSSTSTATAGTASDSTAVQASSGATSPEETGEAVIAADSGLHARPAARLRAIARQHDVELTLSSAGSDETNVASLSALLNLGLVRGDRVRIAARGINARAAIDAAIALLETPEPHDASSRTQPASDTAVSLAPERDTAPGTLAGLAASPGLAVGPLRRFEIALPGVADRADDPERERQALNAALADVDAALAQAMQTAEARGQSAEAEIFEAHRAWLADPDLRAAAESEIAAGRSAGRAWFLALEGEVERLRASSNALLAGRVDDLRDLQRQVMQHFATEPATPINGLDGAILIARELTPSQFVEVAERIAGLCLAGGGLTSHVSILARARGLPCLVAMGDAVLDASSASACLEVGGADSQRGVLELTPDARRLATIEAERERRREQAAAEQSRAFEPVVTRDGRHLHVGANIASASDARCAAEAGADGVGLMRSEFLFLARQSAPELAEQKAEYRAAIEALGGKPVVVRLLDIGADKQLPYLRLPATPNPALGERGVRLWQTHPAMFDAQLDALLETSRELPPGEDGKPSLRLMVPMISDVTELRWVRERLQSRAVALGIERLPALGVMIEVPSAALCAAALAREADFLSIGTNDLTQYALAMDREVASLAERNDVLHPGVLRLIGLCLEGAAGQCPVAVCGAAAGDPLAGAVLAAIGVDELSVEPSRIAAVKAMLRQLDAAALKSRLPSLLALEDAAAVRAMLNTLLPAAGADVMNTATSAETTTRS